jgi:hypothetical protein
MKNKSIKYNKKNKKNKTLKGGGPRMSMSKKPTAEEVTYAKAELVTTPDMKALAFLSPKASAKIIGNYYPTAVAYKKPQKKGGSKDGDNPLNLPPPPTHMPISLPERPNYNRGAEYITINNKPLSEEVLDELENILRFKVRQSFEFLKDANTKPGSVSNRQINVIRMAINNVNNKRKKEVKDLEMSILANAKNADEMISAKKTAAKMIRDRDTLAKLPPIPTTSIPKPKLTQEELDELLFDEFDKKGGKKKKKRRTLKKRGGNEEDERNHGYVKFENIYDNSCPICGDNLKDGIVNYGTVYQLPCGHQFHNNCLLSYCNHKRIELDNEYILYNGIENVWRRPRVKYSCPLCRKKNISEDDQCITFDALYDHYLWEGDQYRNTEYTGIPTEDINQQPSCCTISGGKISSK